MHETSLNSLTISSTCKARVNGFGPACPPASWPLVCLCRGKLHWRYFLTLCDVCYRHNCYLPALVILAEVGRVAGADAVCEAEAPDPGSGVVSAALPTQLSYEGSADRT